MMNNLSTLVKFMNDLRLSASLAGIKREIELTKERILATPVEERYVPVINQLTLSLDKLEVPINGTEQQINEFLCGIIAEIDERAAPRYSKQYNKNMQTTVDRIRSEPQRPLRLTEDIKRVLISRIVVNVDWHYPGLHIGPIDGKFTDQLVSCDPLYLISEYQEFLDCTASQYNSIYKNRLRPYLLDKSKEAGFLDDLPQNQFGFVFAWEYFNFLALETIQEYLISIYKVLRPGGVALFSFNDGDNYLGACNSDWGGQTFVPKRLLLKACSEIGFELVSSFNYSNESQDISWLEIRKPGTKQTVKAHQTMGMVKRFDE